MNMIRNLVLTAAFFGASFSQAALQSEAIEASAHHIVQLAYDGRAPKAAATQMQAVYVERNANGFLATVTLNPGTGATARGAVVLIQLAEDLQVIDVQNQEGAVDSTPSVFNQQPVWHLFDLAAEFINDSKDPAYRQFGVSASSLVLKYDEDRNAAHFEMIGSEGKKLNLWLELSGEVLDYKFE